jgi:phage gpG-like protein
VVLRFEVDPSTIADIDALIAKVQLARQKSRKRQPLMTEVRRRQARSWLRNFDAEGGRYGGWEPLSRRTISNRKWLGFSAGPKLKRSGTLRNIVSTQSYRGIVSDTDVTWDFENTGSGSDNGGYPLYHTLGTKHIPPRVFWWLNEQDNTSARNAGGQWLNGLVEEVF